MLAAEGKELIEPSPTKHSKRNKYQFIRVHKSFSGNVIGIALSYRLGLNGFLFGNWGLFDLIEGLQWVQRNAEAFSGDANNVTIFGQSSGGWSVDALMRGFDKISTIKI